MLIFIRVIVACLLGALIGSLVSCIRSPRTEPAAPAAVVTEPPPRAPAVTLPFTQQPTTEREKTEKKEGVAAPIEPIYRDDSPDLPLYVTGYVMRGRLVNVQLSDGRILTENDIELQKPAYIKRNALHLSTGQRLFMLGRRPQKDVSPVHSESNQSAGANVESQPAQVDQANVPPRSSWSMGPDGIQTLVAPGSIGGR